MKRKIRIQRGSQDDLRLEEFEVEVEPGMVILDAIHLIQATEAPDLAIRWNCLIHVPNSRKYDLQ